MSQSTHSRRPRPRPSPPLLVFSLAIPMFAPRVVFVIGQKPSDSALLKICRRFRIFPIDATDTPTLAGDQVGSTLSFRHGHCLVWLEAADHHYLPSVFGIFAHEIIHVVTTFGRHIGEQPSWRADELHAHLAQYLTEHAWARILKRRGQSGRRPIRRHHRRST